MGWYEILIKKKYQQNVLPICPKTCSLLHIFKHSGIIATFCNVGLTGGYLNFSHLTELKKIYITEIYMKKQYKSSRIKNKKITKKRI